MKKGTFISDTFEKAEEELIKPTGKGVAKAVKETFNPKTLLEQVFSLPQRSPDQLEKGMGSKDKHTPLNFEKLKKAYEKQDKNTAEVLKNRYFQRVKSEEEKVFEEEKQAKMQKTQQEVYAEKQRKIQEQQIGKQRPIESRGKTRRFLFSKKKVASREQVEVKPASGKQ